jgi:hypothetical protein
MFKKVLSQEDSKFVDPILQNVRKSSFFHLKHYDLVTYVTNLFEKNSTRYIISLKQDPWLNLKNK